MAMVSAAEKTDAILESTEAAGGIPFLPPLDVTAVKLGVDLWMEDKRLKLEGLCCKNDDFFELDVEVTLEAAAGLGLFRGKYFVKKG